MMHTTEAEWSEVTDWKADLASSILWNGRPFANQGPLGYEAGDTNLYRYVGNSPATVMDPTGFINTTSEVPWAATRYYYEDPYVVREQGEDVRMIVATAKGAILNINEKECTYVLAINISSQVPAKPRLHPAGVNVRTEYFLRQLFAEKNPGMLDITFAGPQPLRGPDTSFTMQSWQLPPLNNVVDLRKNLISEGQRPSEAIITATFRVLDNQRLSGEGSGTRRGGRPAACGSSHEPGRP